MVNVGLSKNFCQLHPVQNLGQVFTPDSVVRALLALRKNKGCVLEPACGDGAISNAIPGCVALEIDPRVAPKGSLTLDFFAFPEMERFETIIGNPPYVRFQDIPSETKRLLKSDFFDARSNLYLFFIEKSIRHLTERGEVIFITPRDFLKSTSSIRLNQWLYQQGTITHAIDLGDARVFHDAVPNCLIWRYEKGDFSRKTQYAKISAKDDLDSSLGHPQWEIRTFMEDHGHLMFVCGSYSLHLHDIASVKVGAVSGADDIYVNEEFGNLDFVYSETAKTGKTRKMIWVEEDSPPPDYLLPFKERLLSRRIRRFDESNWWHWGRGFPKTQAPRVYVNVKTRNPKPFFIHLCPRFDGSILAIFPHRQDIDLRDFCSALNEVRWEELGYVCDGRFLFSQRSLMHALLPDTFVRFLP